MTSTTISIDDNVLEKFIRAKLEDQAGIGKQLNHSEYLDHLLEERRKRKKP